MSANGITVVFGQDDNGSYRALPLTEVDGETVIPVYTQGAAPSDVNVKEIWDTINQDGEIISQQRQSLIYKTVVDGNVSAAGSVNSAFGFFKQMQVNVIYCTPDVGATVKMQILALITPLGNATVIEERVIDGLSDFAFFLGDCIPRVATGHEQINAIMPYSIAVKVFEDGGSGNSTAAVNFFVS